jgi:CBS domain-containing protein
MKSEYQSRKGTPPVGSGVPMSEVSVIERILVSEIMSRPVITVKENARVPEVASLMKEHYVGCIIITNDDKKPVGIVTEKDLVTRVLAEITDENLGVKVLNETVEINKLFARDIMSSPLITVTADETINQAARKMRKHGIRRLCVMQEGNLLGIVSSKDILAVTPELLEIFQAKVQILKSKEDATGDVPSLAGYCDHCGNWSPSLKEVNSEFLCEECQTEQVNL